MNASVLRLQTYNCVDRHYHESACLSKLSGRRQVTVFKDVKFLYPILGKFKNRSIKKKEYLKYDDTTITRVF